METKKAIKALFIIAFVTAIMSLGLRTSGGEIIQIWALVLAVASAGAFTLAITLPKYSKENQSTKLFSALVNLGLMILLFGTSFTLLHKINGLIAIDLQKNGPGQFMASAWSNTSGVVTGAKVATMSIKKDGVVQTLDVEANAARVVGAIFLVVISYIVIGRGFMNSIPPETKASFVKFFGWIIILAVLSAIGYVLYKVGLFEWVTELIKSKTSTYNT